MKRWLKVVGFFCLFVGMVVVTSAAQAKPNQKSAEASAFATHAEMARQLVQVLGLARFLPPNPSAQQCFAVLLNNSISPKDGWQPDKIVTKADLARVVVQALKKQGEIKNPDNAKEWIDYLAALGVPIDSLGEALYYVDPLSEPVAPHVATARTDPLLKRHRFSPIDETQYGVDMEFLARLLSQFEFTDGEFRPQPVTPD